MKSSRQHTLGKFERLKSRKAIELLFSKGKKLIVAPYRVLYEANGNSNTPGLLFGTAVSSKVFKKAVDRNRIKRLTREAYRLQKKALADKAVLNNIQLQLFFIYTGKEVPRHNEVSKKIGAAIKKMEELIAL
jgi:ribonuclease P protein component